MSLILAYITIGAAGLLCLAGAGWVLVRMWVFTVTPAPRPDTSNNTADDQAPGRKRGGAA